MSTPPVLFTLLQPCVCVRLICWVTHKFVSATNASTLTGPKLLGLWVGRVHIYRAGFEVRSSVPKDVWVVKLLLGLLPGHRSPHMCGKWSRALSIQCSLCCPPFIRSFRTSFVLILSCFPCIFLCHFYAILNFMWVFVGDCVCVLRKNESAMCSVIWWSNIFSFLFFFVASARKCDSGILSNIASDLECPGRLKLCYLSLKIDSGAKGSESYFRAQLWYFQMKSNGS